MNETLTPNTVADIKTEFELEREKIKIERERIDLERERLAAERERWQHEVEWRARASGRMVPVSTLVYVGVICVLTAGVSGWLGGSLVAKKESKDIRMETRHETEETIFKTLASITGSTEGTNTVINIQRGGGSLRFLVE